MLEQVRARPADRTLCSGREDRALQVIGHLDCPRVIVEHMVYPVTLDVIFQIFSRVGKVMKIVTFTKNNTFQVNQSLLPPLLPPPGPDPVP